MADDHYRHLGDEEYTWSAVETEAKVQLLRTIGHVGKPFTVLAGTTITHLGPHRLDYPYTFDHDCKARIEQTEHRARLLVKHDHAYVAVATAVTTSDPT